jgi:DNA-binding CsgD family transcriptional regulator
MLFGITWKTMKSTGLYLGLLLVSLLCSIELPGQTSVACRSQPFVRNYTKSQYGGANQNWAIAQDHKGILYYGNTYGLLEYNGADWKLHTDPEINMVRSVFADSSEKIYTGSFEEFGYWQRNSFGELYYTSISQDLPDQEAISNVTIWRIFRCGEYIFLHSFVKIFVCDGEKIIHSIDTEKIFLPMFEYKGRPYVSISDSGLFYINESFALIREPGPEMLSGLRVQNMFVVNKDTSLVFTEYSGVFFKIGNSIFPTNSPDNEYLKNSHINRVIQISNTRYAIGTFDNGVIIADCSGNIQSRLDRSNGLQNNAVMDLHQDQDNNLWIALQEGIDFTEIMSPYLFVEDKTGQIGSVRCSIKYRDKLYLGTNHGLFYADWEKLINEEETVFRAVPGLAGHVLNLDVIDDQLFCGYNLGTFIVDGSMATELSNIGGSRILVNPLNGNVGYQGLYSGLGLYKKKKSGNWEFIKVLLESSETKYLQVDHEGNLWTSFAYKGLLFHQLNKTGDSILHSIYFGKKDGFISDNTINVFKLGNSLVFSNEGSFFTYDYLNRKIVPYDWLNKQLGPYANAHIIYEESPSVYWFINRSSLGQFHYFYDSLALKYEIQYDFLHSSAVEYVENITRTDDGYYAIGLVDGVAILDYSKISDNEVKPPLHNIQLNCFQCFNKIGNEQKVDISASSNPRISFRNRNLLVDFSVPGSTRELLTFSYRFSNSDPWSDLGSSNVLRYNNLIQGTYQLEIRAVEEVSGRATTLTFPFYVSPPWYLHWIAIVSYLILITGVSMAIRKIYLMRLQHHQKEYQKKIKHESEEKMAQLKQEYLQRELRNKSKELVNYTILLDKRTELLERLKSMLGKELDHPEMPARELNMKLLKIIDDNISNRDDWPIFKAHFDAANSDFLEKLKHTHHNLTPSDLRFCGFLRMNLTSKEISSLLSISLRSIEVKRYRLRKKLNLEHDQNLIEYLMEV